MPLALYIGAGALVAFALVAAVVVIGIFMGGYGLGRRDEQEHRQRLEIQRRLEAIQLEATRRRGPVPVVDPFRDCVMTRAELEKLSDRAGRDAERGRRRQRKTEHSPC